VNAFACVVRVSIRDRVGMGLGLGYPVVVAFRQCGAKTEDTRHLKALIFFT